MSYPAWKNPLVLPLSWSLHVGQRTRVNGRVVAVLGVRKSPAKAIDLVRRLRAELGQADIAWTAVSTDRYCYGIVFQPVEAHQTAPVRQAIPV